MFNKDELKILTTLLKIKNNTLIFLFLMSSFVNAAPQSGKVTSGQANISTKENITNIIQSTKKASINWDKFNITNSETVNFKQPNKDSITLNKVIGGERSVINGSLNANGQVWILNSNGILFGKNAKINTAGLLATTKNLTDENFLKGNYDFKGNSKNSVINLGEIEITNSGYAALLGHKVSNKGNIKAVKGVIKLIGASEYSINLNGNSLVSLKVDKSFIDSLVENEGALIANGGEIYLTTSSAEELLKGTVNNSGVIEANSFEDITGYVELFAHGGEVKVGGSIKAKDGFVETSGKDFFIAENTTVESKKWMIDPVDITIDETLATTIETTLKSGNVTIQTTDSQSSINNSAQSTDTSGDGNITVNSPITWSANNILTLDAYNNIVINEDINHTGTSSGGVIFLYGQELANGGTSTYTLASGKSVNADSIQWRKGSNLNSYRYAIVNNNLYIGTEFIELGLNSSLGGKFGVTTKPSLFFGRKTGGGIGMTGDADGFGVGNDLRIDYFLPGTPAEQFTVAYGDNYEVAGKNFASDPSKYKLLGLNNKNELEMSVVSSLSNLDIKQVFTLGLTDKYYNNNVTLTNTSDTDLSNVTFIRSFDPDNTVDYGGGYATINTVEKLISAGDSSTVVSAQSSIGDSYYSTTGNQAKVLFFTTDNEALVGYGSEFFSGQTSSIKTMINTAEGLSKGSTTTGDIGIGIIFKDETLSASAEKKFSYYTSLDNKPIETIIDELNHIDSTPLIYTLSNITKTYNSNSYLLSDYYTSNSIFGPEYSDWMEGADYNFVYDGNFVTSFTDAGIYEVYIDILKEGYTEAASENTNSFFTINTKAITTDFSASNKVYDGNTDTNISLNSLSGIIDGDSVALSNTAYGTFADKNVGTNKIVTISDIALNGEDANNYHLVSSTNTATANIDKRDINATFVAANKTYDGNNNATVSFSSWDNLVVNDKLNTSNVSAFFNNKNAGTDKAVSISGTTLSGIDANNYNLVNSNSSTASINKRDINATFVAANKTYNGETLTELKFSSWDNYLNNDDLFAKNYIGNFIDPYSGTNKDVIVTNTILTGSDKYNYNLVTSTSTSADITENKVKYLLDSIDKINSIQTPLTSKIKVALDSPQRKNIVSIPKVGKKTKKITYSEVQSLQGTTETSVPLGENSIIIIRGPGINLTFGNTQIEQIFYVADPKNDK